MLKLFLLFIAAGGSAPAAIKVVEQGVDPAPDKPPLRALIVTCNSKYLPEPGEAFGFKAQIAEVSGVAMGKIGDAEKLVKPESYHGGGFVEFDKDLPCFILRDPNYVATIWNPDKTKVWCGVYDGIFVRARDCVEGPVLEK